MIEDRITKYFKGLLKLGANLKLLSYVYNPLFIARAYQIHISANRSIKLLPMGLFGPFRGCWKEIRYLINNTKKDHLLEPKQEHCNCLLFINAKYLTKRYNVRQRDYGRLGGSWLSWVLRLAAPAFSKRQ